MDTIDQEGVTWEGQVLVVGHDDDLAARLIITSERFLLTHRDTILLEAPRSWLIPAPLVVADNGVRFSITPEGVVPGRDTTERLHLRIRDGRGPAVQLVAILTGRSRASQQSEAELPSWKTGVGAGRSSSLPPLPTFETRQDEAPTKRAITDDPETRGVAPLKEWRSPKPDSQPAGSTSLRASDPEPVEAQSRAGRFLAQRSVVGPAAPAETADASSDKVASIDEERRKRRAGWLIWTSRVAVLALVILAAGWFGRHYLPDEVTTQLPAFVTSDLASNLDQPEADTDSTAEDGDGTNGADNDPENIMPTQAALGVGGASTTIPDGEVGGSTAPNGQVPTPTPPVGDGEEGIGDTGNPESTGETANPENTGDTGNPEDTADTGQGETAQEQVPTQPVIVETQEPPASTAPAEETADTVPTGPVIDPTDVPVEETEVVQPGEPTTEPTAPVEETIGAPTTEATITPSETVVAPNTEPTVTATATDVAETPVATATVEETPEPTPTEPALEPQAASVNPESPPEQEFVDQGFRYSVEGASTGSNLPELPQVAEVTYGEWVVLAVDGKNWTDSEQVFDMSRFTLLADGEPIQLDVGNSWVASLLSYTPAYGNTDSILWAPGEEHEFVLTFLAPNDAESLVLQAGDQRFDLSPVLANAKSLTNATQNTAPEVIEARVVGVVDGETIVIEKDGIEQTVRYLGIDVPEEDDCFANESTEANRMLVEGRNVKIERQATNVDAQGNWVRDVWVETDDGRYVLAAHHLVAEGAAEADISQPNTRFTGWVRGAEAVAQAEGRGLWGACGSAGSDPVLLSTMLADNNSRRVGVLT